ncbi:MAG: UvrD-helicase domain-containing protein [Flavobacteriaceae bacterium]|nr:UvrD-helicase domain-containing protein [Flavobacteriaceae bacterium]
MNNTNSFVIYNASAGSGKTFALVKSYLLKILNHPSPDHYKHLLAITFTNKAVAEMKSRIVDTLVLFASESHENERPKMLDHIISESNLSEKEIRSRSKSILKHLLHHYAQFSVETIDHFNHRLIRTFARDLKLSHNFEVSLEVKDLIYQAVDQLIDLAGEDPEITEFLVAFALQKTDDDRSWDIAFDLRKTAMLLANENDVKHLSAFRDKPLNAFVSLQKKLKKKKKQLEDEIQQSGARIYNRFKVAGLESSHFYRKQAYVFFQNISNGDFDLNFDTQWQKSLSEKPLYPARVKDEIAQLIDAMVPEIEQAFLAIKQTRGQLALVDNLLRNLVPLATIQMVNKELEKIKISENILPISEFNAIIHQEIKNQPAPFIYERLGDRYRDFFIDEFQDTSELQWKNLIPLIDNALSQQFQGSGTGSLFLVGDAKQSIYRWRGGLPEQFIKLYSREHPFSIDLKEIKTLDSNYRSRQEIVEFNNEFFTYVANHFSNEDHRQLYIEGNEQQVKHESGGHVCIEFLPEETKDLNLEFNERIYFLIQGALEDGYKLNDICVLTRKKKEGVAISEFLLEKQIGVVSEETLLISNSVEVNAVVHLLELSIKPNNDEIKIELLAYLYEHFPIEETKHAFFKLHLPLSPAELFASLKEHLPAFNFEKFRQLPLYESCEYAVEEFGLNNGPNAFLLSFMELVHNFSLTKETGVASFLQFWAMEKERASIAANENTNAVKVMTIHKAKGLEFPMVIFPYADLDVYKEIDGTAWYPVEEEDFGELLIQYNKDVANYGVFGEQLVEDRRSILQLDNLNLLYVAMTRAEHRLYVLSKFVSFKEPPTNFAHYFEGFLQETGQWEEGKNVYEFGAPVPLINGLKKETIIPNPISYLVSSPEAHQIKFVGAHYESADPESVRFGNLLHEAMAAIEKLIDVDPVLEDFASQLKHDPVVQNKLEQTVRAIVDHRDLLPLFMEEDLVFNEREIITPDAIVRPDRINIHSGDQVTIIDYKTGTPSEDHEHQINGYAMALSAMGYEVKNRFLVYSYGEEISINKL